MWRQKKQQSGQFKNLHRFIALRPVRIILNVKKSVIITIIIIIIIIIITV